MKSTPLNLTPFKSTLFELVTLKSALLKTTSFKSALLVLVSFKSTLFKSTLFKLFLLFKILSFVVFSFLMLSCSPEDDGIYFEQSAMEIPVSKVSYSDMELDILDLVNAYRKSKKLSELKLLNVISSVADGHTNYMISEGQASHDNFSQRSQDLITNANAKTVGENVAYGFSSAQGVFNGWLNSSGHTRIIENPEYTHFGISTDSDTEGRNYFTHIFISK